VLRGALAPMRYHGFLVVAETCVDGWCLGLISEPDETGADSGDAIVVAPDGTQAALVWEVGTEAVEEILPPDAERWGVYAVHFPKVVRDVSDLVAGFHAVLPALRAIHAELHDAK
jgi:hypothetical protein